MSTPQVTLTSSLSASRCLSRVSQRERRRAEAAVGAAAAGRLPECRAGGAARLDPGAPEAAGPAEAAEGGPGDAAGTSAHRGPARVRRGAGENDRYTTHTHTHTHEQDV